MGANASNPLVLYEQGKIDVCYVNSYALARVQDENNPLSNELTSVPQLAISYIGMNVTMPPFDDANVRKSFALLLDYERLRDVTWNGSIAIARGILPPGMPGYNPNIPQRETSIARAKELLKESKYGENLPPIAAYGSGTLAILRDVAEEELGVTFEIRNFENYAEYLDALKQAEMPMYSTGWIADYPDPENFLDLLFRTGSQENHSLYSNPEVDRLLDEAATEEETEERWKLYRQAEQIIMEDMPVIPVYHDIDHILVKPYVEGLVLTPMGILDLSTVKLAR
jgi:ABC-type oligopeptide transport system substrate-binding subunit